MARAPAHLLQGNAEEKNIDLQRFFFRCARVECVPQCASVVS